MTDNEKIQSFADMVDAVEKLTKPTQEENVRLHSQIDKMHEQMKEMHRHMWWERLAFVIIFLAFIICAYMSPVEMEQDQEFEAQTQNQSYSDGFMSGK